MQFIFISETEICEIGESGAGRPAFQFLIFNKLCGRNIIQTGSIAGKIYI